jgi:hypothetical protein
MKSKMCLHKRTKTGSSWTKCTIFPPLSCERATAKMPLWKTSTRPELEGKDVISFQCRQNRQGARPKSVANIARLARPNLKARQGPGSNIERYRMYCYFCKLQGNREEECWSRKQTLQRQARKSQLAKYLCDGHTIKSEQNREQLVFH